MAEIKYAIHKKDTTDMESERFDTREEAEAAIAEREDSENYSVAETRAQDFEKDNQSMEQDEVDREEEEDAS